MIYLLVKWHHDHRDEPVLLYSELDDQRWEKRKVYLWADGRCGYADEHVEVGSVGLSTEALPTLQDIAAQDPFEPIEIAADEFEKVWRAARAGWTYDEAPPAG